MLGQGICCFQVKVDRYLVLSCGVNACLGVRVYRILHDVCEPMPTQPVPKQAGASSVELLFGDNTSSRVMAKRCTNVVSSL